MMPVHNASQLIKNRSQFATNIFPDTFARPEIDLGTKWFYHQGISILYHYILLQLVVAKIELPQQKDGCLQHPYFQMVSLQLFYAQNFHFGA